MNVLGGENVLLMGGGGAYATGSNGFASKVMAQANVEGTATLIVQNGSVDGLYGGGMAIDDTNSDAVNAVANTKDVVIAVTGGEVNRANMGVILNTAHGNTLTPVCRRAMALTLMNQQIWLKRPMLPFSVQAWRQVQARALLRRRLRSI